jgi:hypothetical protein
LLFELNYFLAVSTAATTVEATASTAMEAAATTGKSVAYSAASKPVTRATACEAVCTTDSTCRAVVDATAATRVTYSAAISYAVAATISVAAAIAPTAATPITATTPVAVIPRAGADKDAADEPARTVVAVRCASIRVVRVIAPAAHRSWTVAISIVISVTRTNPNAHPDLSVRRSGQHSRRNENHAKQQ